MGQFKGAKWPYGNQLPWRIGVDFATQQTYAYQFTESDFSDEGDAQLELAYALTVHKAQGSGFGKVVLVLPHPCRLLSRELLYTALTRQEQKIWILHQGELADLRGLGSNYFSESGGRITNLFAEPQLIEVAPRRGGELRLFEDGCAHRTRRGDSVRSKSEVIIADLLDRLGLDYRYEEPLGDQHDFKLPDFTIEDDASGPTLYIEHAGLLDDPAYTRPPAPGQDRLAHIG